MSVSAIHDAVREGRLSPEDGAMLLELRRDIAKAVRRRERRARLRRAIRFVTAPLRWLWRH